MTQLNELLAEGGSYPVMLAAGDYDGAKSVAKATVSKIREWVEKETVSEAALETVLHARVFFRALFDFAILQEMVGQTNWASNTALVEKAWDKMWDCRERLGSCDGKIQGPLLDRVRASLDGLEAFYLRRFGPGQYASPEILMRRGLCSICNDDIRRCIHVSGRVYVGRLCSVTPEPIAMESVSIVLVPRDPRCRIWPWQFKGDKASGIKILSVFRIDDFVDSGDWK